MVYDNLKSSKDVNSRYLTEQYVYRTPGVYLRPQNRHKILRSPPSKRQIQFFPDVTFVMGIFVHFDHCKNPLQEPPWQLSEVGNFCPEFMSTHIKNHQLVRSRDRWKHFLVLDKRESATEQRISSPSESLEQELSSCKPYFCRYPMELSRRC